MAHDIPEEPTIKKIGKVRVQQKNETETDWSKARGFLPLKGEIIVYNPDDTHNAARLKVGNGSTPLINLPFIQEGFIDSELSDTSENAVQNKVVKSELDKRQDKITSETSLTIGDLDIQTTLTLKNSDESSNVEAILMSGSSQYRNDIEYPSIDFYGRTTEDYDTHNVILSNIETPEENNQAANKSYVDTEVAKNKITIDTALSSTSTNPVQNKVINTAFAGKANASHTHSINAITATAPFNTTSSVDYISRSLVPYVSGTKFYGMPAAAITVEYSRDGGATWIDYGLSDAQKMNIFDHSGLAGLYLGKATTKADNNINNMLRITVDATKSDGRYLSTDSMFTWMTSNGNTVYVTLEVAPYNAPTTFKTIVNNAWLSGWPGPNMSHYGMTTFGGSRAGSTSPNNQFYRLTYKQTAINSNYPSVFISDIRFFGSTVWSSGSGTAISNNMLKQGVPYSIRINSDSKSGTINFTLLGAAFGNCASDGKFSLAGGLSTTTGHEGSIAYGEALNTSARCQAIFGRYNATNSSALLQVGNGSSAGVKNAFSVFADGHAEVQTQGTTDNSVVIKSELPTIITF